MFNAPVTGWLIYFAIVATPLVVVLVVNYILWPRKATFRLSSNTPLSVSPYKPMVWVGVEKPNGERKTIVVSSATNVQVVVKTNWKNGDFGWVEFEDREFLNKRKFRKATLFVYNLYDVGEIMLALNQAGVFPVEAEIA